MKNIEEFSGGKKSQESGPAGRKKDKKRQRESNKTRQNNKRGDSKVESNYSPETPEKGGDTKHPWLIAL